MFGNSTRIKFSNYSPGGGGGGGGEGYFLVKG